jgi:16S rRNA (guanine527-N7)-methyltransferase
MALPDPDRASTRAASAPDAVEEAGASSGSPAAPPAALALAAEALFGSRLPLAVEYADLLVGEGVRRGLIGPREGPRIWDRHLLNCAALARGDLIPYGAYVADVGSGAGLPGIVLAVARPDIHVVLIDSLARRGEFLTEAVSALALERVDVVRARAEECAGKLPPADIVTSRAVAPLERLSAWCLPLARIGGAMLAIKGASAADEIAEHRDTIRRLGGGAPVLRMAGVGILAEPVPVVEVRRLSVTPSGRRGDRGASGRRGERDGGGRTDRGGRPPSDDRRRQAREHRP